MKQGDCGQDGNQGADRRMKNGKCAMARGCSVSCMIALSLPLFFMAALAACVGESTMPADADARTEDGAEDAEDRGDIAGDEGDAADGLGGETTADAA